MKFTNAYELFKTLYDRDFLKGFYIKQVFMLSGKYDFSLFQLKCSHDEAKKALKMNDIINYSIASFGQEKLQKIIFEYFVKLQNGNVDYHGIHLEIEKNELQTFQGFGADKDELFKDYLENYPLDFTIDLDQIENKI
jgi:hypothetical protein